MQNKKGKVFVLIGPTAVGKNTLISEVCDRSKDLIRMPSATTRPKRTDEIDGISKVFLSDEEFDSYIQKGSFVEWQVIHGYRYGVLKDVIEKRINEGKDYMADVEVLGAMELKKCYGDSVVLIFVIPPSFDDLQERIKNRSTESDQDMMVRLNRSKSELCFMPKCDVVLLNDDLEVAVGELKNIVNNYRENNINLDKKTIKDMISVRILVLDSQKKNLLFLEKYDSLMLPETVIRNNQYPHEGLISYLSNNVVGGIKILEDKSYLDGLNKGLDIPRPLWVSFNRYKSEKKIDFIYAVVAEEDNVKKGGWIPLEEAKNYVEVENKEKFFKELMEQLL